MSIMATDLRLLAADALLRLERLDLPEPAVKICIAGLTRMAQVLGRPPRIALMGEVNSGKTSVADLLLGDSVLPSSVVTNTHVPTLIRYADAMSLHAVTQKGRHQLTEDTLDQLPSGLQLKRIEIGLPDERLRDFEILDTPGDYMPGGGQPDAQVFLWCTVATRAWAESERAHWSELPHRCWSNGLLVVTHKDAIVSADDLAKIEHRLRTATAGMFRDMIFVTATGSGLVGFLSFEEEAPDESAQALLARISDWAAEISVRRARKAERIIRHLARLTFHRLAPGPLSYDAEAILKTWQADSDKLLTGIDGSPASVALVIQALLVRFAHSMNEARAGRVVTRPPVALPESGPPASGPYRAAAARRYVGLIAADLTALLRIDLARWGMPDKDRFEDYLAARSALLPLANLDATFDELGQRFASDPAPAAEQPADADAVLAQTRRL